MFESIHVNPRFKCNPNFKTKRVALGISQKQMCEKLCFSLNYYRKIEVGKIVINHILKDELERIIKVAENEYDLR